jgi:hypothetical protein
MYTQQEVEAAVGRVPEGTLPHLVPGPYDLLAPLVPGSATSHAHTFVTVDRHYVSARFWGDAYAFGQVFTEVLESSGGGAARAAVPRSATA